MSGSARLASFRVAMRQDPALGAKARADCRRASVMPLTSARAGGPGGAALP